MTCQKLAWWPLCNDSGTSLLLALSSKTSANISWLYFGWAGAQEESWHAVWILHGLQILYHFFSSLIYTEGNQTLARFRVLAGFLVWLFRLGRRFSLHPGIKTNNLKQTYNPEKRASEIFENVILLYPFCLGNRGTDCASVLPEQHWTVLGLLQILPSCSWLKERVSKATFLVSWPHLCLRAQSPAEADAEWQTGLCDPFMLEYM